jgi:copper chaperone
VQSTRLPITFQEFSMIEFTINDMSCGHCASMITKTVHALDAQAKVDVDLAQKKVQVESTEDRVTLAAALTEAGYPPA